MTKDEILQAIRGRLIVSCQAQPGEPLYSESDSIMHLLARAAKRGGAVAIRTESLRDVLAIKKETGLPVIGLIKIHYPGFDSYITPTLKEVDALVAVGADIVATDCTLRRRGDGQSVASFIKSIKTKHPTLLLMADISTCEEGICAARAGADFVGTTMSGYTEESRKIDGPDLQLIRELNAALDIPVIGEGKIRRPEEARAVLAAGAYAVVVGGAITRPMEITERFCQVLEGADRERMN